MDKIKNILLIDDSLSTNLYHKNMVHEVLPSAVVFDYQSVDESIEHLSKLENENPDIIFLDLSMPDKDGFQFMREYTEKFRSQTMEKSPLVVIVSEYLNFENFNETKKFKLDGLAMDHVRKPLLKSDIELLIEEHFD